MIKKKDERESYDGFEEFIEHFSIKSNANEPASKTHYGKKRHEAQLQLINFMELELKRLSKLIGFISQKLPVLQQSGHGDKVAREIAIDANMLQDALIVQLSEKNSPTNQHIEHLWSITFSQASK